MVPRPSWLDTPPPLESLRDAPQPARAGTIRIGTASWTDRSLLDSGTFYPGAVRTPAQRLQYYARHFSMVEVDASYYAIPPVRTAHAWIERTPGDFLFGIKAYAALTQHPFEPQRLERDLQAALPANARRAARLYPRDVPEEILDAIWEGFLGIARILQAGGKLGYVLFQMPPWFRPTRESRLCLEHIGARTKGLPVAVEFRQPQWMAEAYRHQVLEFLRGHALAYVCVDEPQGTPASVPPITEATCDRLAVVRFHGRRRATWAARGVGVAERFRYLYSRDELREWVPRIRALAKRVATAHVVMNNCYREYGVQNAKDIAALLTEP